MLKPYVLHFHEIDKSDLPHVGGKGANLGEMTKAGFPVPAGFCLSTEAYRTFIRRSVEMNKLFEQLDEVQHGQLEQIRMLGQRIRDHLHSIRIPEDVEASLVKAWQATGTDHAYAVRSSATAEDLPTASFAGQQDTYLNVRGKDQLLRAVRNCWASLFTDRAISYRAKNGFDHQHVFLSVVVQQMVFPQASGIMFTADPVTGRRDTVSIDASFGLGEALVSGLVNADLYQVRAGQIIKKQISAKEVAIYAVPEGGTVTEKIPQEQQQVQALTDEQIVELASLGKSIEAHYGSEQDVEWGLVEGKLFILQSRPITSLYPVPLTSIDHLHVLINFGYIQMMTDPLKPLGLSVLSNLLNVVKPNPESTEPYILHHAGGRLFADFTGPLSVAPVRRKILNVISGMDERIASALVDVTSREEFRRKKISKTAMLRTIKRLVPIVLPAACKVMVIRYWTNPVEAGRKASHKIEQIVREEETRIFSATGAERIGRIRLGMGRMPKVISKIVIYWLAGVVATGALKKKLITRVGEEKTDSLLSDLYKSLPGNVTTEFGLALGDLADIIRPYPELVDYLQAVDQADNEHFYDELATLPGGEDFRLELEGFMQQYGMRCAGEIDITNPRWREAPLQLVPYIISNIRTSTPGEHRQKFKKGEEAAEAAEENIVALFGPAEQRKIKRLVQQYRYLMGGMREHHKFVVVKLLDVYKRAIMEEAQWLVEQSVLQQQEDIFYLTLEEIEDLIHNKYQDRVHETVEARKAAHGYYYNLQSPRVIASNGEVFNGKLHHAKVPEGAIVGTPVSSGIVEGVARIVMKPEQAKLNPGDILIAPYTDPGWTPLFTSIAGLVTEVGGMMTHGSVIAREYGIPAVVGIDRATEIIKEGNLIRVDGTNGYVQVLEDGMDGEQ